MQKLSGESIKIVGVVGAGQMGSGIAQVMAEQGISVLLSDMSQSRAEAGKASIAKQLARKVAKGRLASDQQEEILERITPCEGLKAFAPCELVIEAASEQIELKKRLFQDLDKICQPAAILASNTSSISITLLGAQTKRPEQIIGMHFMNPVPVMKLVEIIRGLATSEQTYQCVLQLAERVQKTTITSKDCPGFIVNRILLPLINEACFALQEGLGTAKDIDEGAKLGLNHPMGPLELADLIGLDTCLSIAEVLHRELGEDKYRPANILRNHVQAGWLGRKTGRGFYTYEER